MHLLLAPTFARIILVEAREITVVALVQGLVLYGPQPGLANLLKDQLERVLGAQRKTSQEGSRCRAASAREMTATELASNFLLLVIHEQKCEVTAGAQYERGIDFRFWDDASLRGAASSASPSAALSALRPSRR